MKDKIIMGDDVLVINPNAIYIIGNDRTGYEIRASFSNEEYYVIKRVKTSDEVQQAFKTIYEGHQQG